MPNKAVASGGGAGFGGAIAILIIALWWPDATAIAATALATVCSVVFAPVATYLTKMEGTN